MASLATCCVLGALNAPISRAAPLARAKASQPLAVLLTGQRVHRSPDSRSPVLETVAARRPITGEPTVLPVIGRAGGHGGVSWLRVLLPGRPNGSSGWVARKGIRMSRTDWRVAVELGRRRVTVYRRGRIVKVFAAVVGKPSTPTPAGSFFVEETLQMYAGEPGGPFALALSARSDALQEFEGGPGQIAIHGRDNLGGILGAAESHGCVRLDTTSIDWLAARIGPGVPVRILAN